MAKKVVILSIDGGGIRGIIPGIILNYLEDELRRKAGDDKRLCDYFDLMAGTSTGAILTGLFAIPSPEHPERPKYTTAEAVDLYFKNGPKIFNLNIWQRLESLGGLSDEKYDAREFEKALLRYFGESQLSQLLKPCLITAYDIEKRKTVFFTSIAAAATPVKNFKMRDVVRATASAPTYFEPPRIYAMDGAAYALIDGGVFANNPTLCAYAEARKMNFKNIGKADEPAVEDMLILSIGTGGKSMAKKKPYAYDTFRNAGKLKWIAPIIDIMMSGNAETVDYQTRQIFNTMGGDGADDYHRLEPGIGLATADMDDARPKNMEALKQAAKTYISEHQPELDRIVDKLIAHRAVIDDVLA